MRVSEIVPAVDACINMDIPAHLWGKPGVGKSEIVADIATARGAAFFDIRLSMFDPVDLRGIPAIHNGETVWLRPSIWPKDASRPIVLFFDEMDRAAPAVLGAALQIVLNRRIGEHELPPSVRILAAGNGSTDRGTNRMPDALANRFAHFDVEPDIDSWAAWASRTGQPPMLIAFLRFRERLLWADRVKGENAFATPRQWAQYGRAMALPDATRHAIGRGLVGAAPAGEFEAFIRMAHGLPSIADIIASPHAAPVPTQPGMLYAVSSALARRAERGNVSAIVSYLARLPKEFSVMSMTDATSRDAGLKETHAYALWAAANQDVSL